MIKDANKTDEHALKEILRKIVESCDCECVAVAMVDGDAGRIVRVFIDTPQGVGLTECETTSRAITEYFDRCEEERKPWFEGKFFIEVSSPGLERPLFAPDHYRRFIGKHAAATLADRKKISGVIAEVGEDDSITFAPKEGPHITVPFSDIKKGHLVYVLEKGEKKNAGKSGKKKKQGKE